MLFVIRIFTWNLGHLLILIRSLISKKKKNVMDALGNFFFGQTETPWKTYRDYYCNCVQLCTSGKLSDDNENKGDYWKWYY